MITDLGNDLLSRKYWDHEDLASPHVSKLKGPTLLQDSVPFAKDLPADVVVHPDIFGHIDAHIENLITVGLLHNDWKRLRGATLLDLHMFGQPVDADEPMPREDLVAMSKLLSEGSLSKIKEVLSWIINTREFTISFPNKKCEEWTAQISDILKSNKSDPSNFESLIGRLNHAIFMIPIARH